MNGESLIGHLLADYLWKVGIVAAAVIVAVLAMIVIYRKVGNKR